MSATCVPWDVPRSTTGLSKHDDLMFLHLCPLNQDLAQGCDTGGSANAETTPAGAPAAAADRTQRPDATREGKNG